MSVERELRKSIALFHFQKNNYHLVIFYLHTHTHTHTNTHTRAHTHTQKQTNKHKQVVRYI